MEVRERRSPREKQDMLSTVMNEHPQHIKDLEVDTNAEESSPQLLRPSQKATLIRNTKWQYPMKPTFSNNRDFVNDDDDSHDDEDEDDDEEDDSKEDEDMAIMTTCCCCLSTKNGSITVGIICLIFGFCIAVASCFALINVENFQSSLKMAYEKYMDDVRMNQTVNRFKTIEKLANVNLLIDNLQIAVIVSLIFYSLYTFCSLFMTYGACSDLRTLLLPWIVIEFVPFAIQLAGIVFVFVYGKDDPTLSQGGMYIIAGLVQIISFVMHVYWWMCPVAHYQRMKETTEVEPLVPLSHPFYFNTQKY